MEKGGKKQKHSSLSKLNNNLINKNYFIKNPVSLFWLGGPLPGLTILHNMKRFSKNTVIEDLIYEGYNENKNVQYLERGNELEQNDEKGNKKEVEQMNEEHLKDSSTMEQTKFQAVWDSTQLNEEIELRPHVDVRNEQNRGIKEVKTVETQTSNANKETNLIKRFIGKAIWDLNQLMEELNKGFWIPISCNNNELLSKIIFSSKINEEEENNAFSNRTTHGMGKAEREHEGDRECEQKIKKNGLMPFSKNIANSYKGEYLWQKIISSINDEYEDISKIPQNVIDSVLKDFNGAENE